MATYYSQGRTNHFRVKDSQKFEQEIETLSGHSSIEIYNEDGQYCLLFEDGMPTYSYNEETGEEGEIEMEDVIKKHLADGSVCVMIETGAEKMRYITGYAIAFNNKGDRKVVSLDDIYTGLESFGTFTHCEY